MGDKFTDISNPNQQQYHGSAGSQPYKSGVQSSHQDKYRYSSSQGQDMSSNKQQQSHPGPQRYEDHNTGHYNRQPQGQAPHSRDMPPNGNINASGYHGSSQSNYNNAKAPSHNSEQHHQGNKPGMSRKPTPTQGADTYQTREKPTGYNQSQIYHGSHDKSYSNVPNNKNTSSSSSGTYHGSVQNVNSHTRSDGRGMPNNYNLKKPAPTIPPENKHQNSSAINSTDRYQPPKQYQNYDKGSENRHGYESKGTTSSKNRNTYQNEMNHPASSNNYNKPQYGKGTQEHSSRLPDQAKTYAYENQGYHPDEAIKSNVNIQNNHASKPNKSDAMSRNYDSRGRESHNDNYNKAKGYENIGRDGYRPQERQADTRYPTNQHPSSTDTHPKAPQRHKHMSSSKPDLTKEEQYPKHSQFRPGDSNKLSKSHDNLNKDFTQSKIEALPQGKSRGGNQQISRSTHDLRNYDSGKNSDTHIHNNLQIDHKGKQRNNHGSHQNYNNQQQYPQDKQHIKYDTNHNYHNQPKQQGYQQNQKQDSHQNYNNQQTYINSNQKTESSQQRPCIDQSNPKGRDTRERIHSEENNDKQKYEKRNSANPKNLSNAPTAKRRERIKSHQETGLTGPIPKSYRYSNPPNGLGVFDPTPPNRTTSMSALNEVGQSTNTLTSPSGSGMPQTNLQRATSLPTINQQVSNMNPSGSTINMNQNGSMYRPKSILSLAMAETGQTNLRRSASLASLVASNPNLARTASTYALYEMQVEKGMTPRDHQQTLVLSIIATILLPPLSWLLGGLSIYVTVKNKPMWKMDMQRAIQTNTRVFWSSVSMIGLEVLVWFTVILVILLHFA